MYKPVSKNSVTFDHVFPFCMALNLPPPLYRRAIEQDDAGDDDKKEDEGSYTVDIFYLIFP